MRGSGDSRGAEGQTVHRREVVTRLKARDDPIFQGRGELLATDVRCRSGCPQAVEVWDFAVLALVAFELLH
jgi:hypothetical protein